MAFFVFDQSLSFPTAGQGNDDSGNETPCDKVNLFHCDSNDFSMTSAELKKTGARRDKDKQTLKI